MIDPTPSQHNPAEAFYSELRSRVRDREIVGPLKLKTHSSLERVYNKLRVRKCLDIGEPTTEYNDKTFSEVPKPSVVSLRTNKEKGGVTRNSIELSEYLKRRSNTQLMIKLQKTNAKHDSTLHSPKSPSMTFEDINLKVLKPLAFPEQSRLFKNSIFPELHPEKQYFKAA